MIKKSDNSGFLIGLFLITLLSIVLRSYGLSAQPLTSDDFAVGLSATNYIERGHLGPTMWNHPNVRNILVYLSMYFLGTGVWGLKIVSLTFGSLSVLSLALLTKRIFDNMEIALLAAFFLAIDPLHIDYSRQAVQEVYMAFFYLTGIYLALKYIDSLKPYMLILSGISFGLGIASKWYVVFSLFMTIIFLLYKTLKDPQSGIKEKGSLIVFISSALILLPLTVYLLTFIPWFQRGYSISEWLFLQKAMYIESKTHIGYSPYTLELGHKAYLWFIKPVAYADLAIAAGNPTFLVGISNPFVWLLTIPSIIYLLYKGINKKKVIYYFLFSLFWLSYIPFLLTSRPIWAHTAFSVIPFAFMAIAYTVCDSVEGRKNPKAILLSYLIVVIVASIPLYFLAIGRGYENELLRPIIEMFKPSDMLMPQMAG